MANQRKWHQGTDAIRQVQTVIPEFTVQYADILVRMLQVEPVQYAKTRNFVNGAVTYLSPYISRGVISTRQVYEAVRAKGYPWHAAEKLVSELAWRDFFQRVWQAKGNLIFSDLRQQQPGVRTHQLPVALLEARTGIDAIDKAIEALEATGYMHNHVRMYTASIACNIAGAHWAAPAAWLYYHLLDGDLASNSLSWQWVAAAFSGKKYYCNQENINKYTGSHQQRGYLATTYEMLPPADVPEPLQATVAPNFATALPQTPLPVLDANLPVLLYNSYNLDPLWHKDEAANRILLLEPSHFSKHPVSPRVLQFVQDLASANLPGIQVYAGEVADLKALLPGGQFISKEHPSATHYPGFGESRDWLVPEVSGYFPSFFAYWKKIERYLRW